MVEERLTYLPNEFTRYGRPVIDEVVMHNADVHLEFLDDSCYMLIVHNEKHWWHLNICSKSGRANIAASLYEDNSPEDTDG